ncbi:MAG TPA: DUF2637 domain-containing protein [Streptosporangiaceae bacterium]|nr:DUF2637 domain-containing protein [Streptosporangiaceae bacterium]
MVVLPLPQAPDTQIASGSSASSSTASTTVAAEVVRAHGESGVTARLEPATIDGLVYSSSMVVLYAARHRLAAPPLARWLLALGIVATLAANVAHGWSHGPAGAAVAAWPAASLVGSYELLLWLIRTAAAGAVVRESAADHGPGSADQPVAGLRLVPSGDQDLPEDTGGPGSHAGHGGPGDRSVGPVISSGWATGPDVLEADRGDWLAALGKTCWPDVDGARAVGEDGAENINEAAVAAYRASIDTGKPLSERKLAAMFGKTSRRRARNRMAEAHVTSEAAAPAR